MTSTILFSVSHRISPEVRVPQTMTMEHLIFGRLLVSGLWQAIRLGTFALAVLLPSIFAASGDIAADVVTKEFIVPREHGDLVVRVQSPPADRLAEHPLLLLYFSADRQSSMPDGRYGAPGKIFLEQGHRVASFDLPAHGDRVGPRGSGIVGLSAMATAGEKPFDTFVADGSAVITESIRRGLAEEGGIVTAGVSRGGYCALRLAAADERVSAVAAFAPATDWRVVTEFAAVQDRPEIMALSLDNFAEPLAGRRVYVAIGNHDLRVGTDACTRFVLAISEAERRLGVTSSHLRFHLADDTIGHALTTHWREEGVRFLLEGSTVAQGDPLP